VFSEAQCRQRTTHVLRPGNRPYRELFLKGPYPAVEPCDRDAPAFSAYFENRKFDFTLGLDPMPPTSKLASAASMKAIERDTDQTATLLGITTAWLGKLVDDGWIKKLGRNRFRLGDVVSGYFNYLQDESRRAQKSAAASRVMDARAAQIENIVKRELENLVEVDDVISFQRGIMGVLDRELRTMPGIADPELRREVERQLAVALTRCRRSFEEGRHNLEAGRPIDAGADHED
jgi:hypothetical protein